MKKSTSVQVLGAMSLVLGLMALFNPVKFTITAELIAAWSLIFVGASQIASAFAQGPWKARASVSALGLLTLLLGVYLLSRPVMGVLTMTMIVASFLLLQGVGKALLAFRFTKTSAFWTFLISALLSLVLALMIFNNFPESALTLLGVFLAIELIAVGINLLAVGQLIRRDHS